LFVIYGRNPVREALLSGTWAVKTVLVAREGGDARLSGILDLARQKGVPVEYRQKKEMDELATGGAHQGVAARCSEYRYAAADDLLGSAVETGGILILLDGLSDPRNLGSILRTACCYGVRGVLLPRDRSVRVTAAVMKASSGALLHVPVAPVVNLARVLDDMKDRGFWIYGADPKAGVDPRKIDFSGPVGIVFGSEGKGMRPLVRNKCDALVTLPMSGGFDSLNVSVAAGILLYEVFRSRAERAI